LSRARGKSKIKGMSQPHFIVFANEKGGTGKSTTAVHTAIALAASGHRVGALDLDSRQRTMTRYLENRDATMRRLEKAAAACRYEVLEDQSEAGSKRRSSRLSKTPT
jgi:chromosome partitioning protein